MSTCSIVKYYDRMSNETDNLDLHNIAQEAMINEGFIVKPTIQNHNPAKELSKKNILNQPGTEVVDLRACLKSNSTIETGEH